eukprot:GFYU01006476.1.p1 GENE.GFYU01006476.1~~GFYU01006476.1.p1  ORF type:complete len:197 (+),score=46.60 GFYU01006476.1:2-592(+)
MGGMGGMGGMGMGASTATVDPVAAAAAFMDNMIESTTTTENVTAMDDQSHISHNVPVPASASHTYHALDVEVPLNTEPIVDHARNEYCNNLRANLAEMPHLVRDVLIDADTNAERVTGPGLATSFPAHTVPSTVAMPMSLPSDNYALAPDESASAGVFAQNLIDLDGGDDGLGGMADSGSGPCTDAFVLESHPLVQ